MIFRVPNNTNERYHGLDALRGFALIAGVALHQSMAWLPGAKHWWIVADADPSLILSTLFWWIHSFRLLLFFLLAGFFGRVLLLRLGIIAFVRDRVNRIALPLFAAWPLVFSAIVAVVIWSVLIKYGELPKESPPGPAFTANDFPLTHLWFLWALLWCYAVILVLCMLDKLDPQRKLARWIDSVMRVLCRPGAVLLLATPLAFALAHVPQWSAWFGVPTPDQSLYPNSAAATAFGCAFVFGWLPHRQQDCLRLLSSAWSANVALGLSASIAFFANVGLSPAFAGPVERWNIIFAAVCYAISGWSWALALLGLTLRYLYRERRVRRYVTDASYWVYIIHLPIVMALQVAASLLS